MPRTAGSASEDETAGEVRARVQQGRQAHPQATLREIEQEVDRHLATWRARLVTEAVHQAPEPSRPTCPECATPLQRVGVRERTVLTAQDKRLTLRGPGYRCPACGAGLFPPGGGA